MINRMGLATKIGCGFGVTIILMLIISISGWTGLDRVVNGFTEYRRYARNNVLSGRIQTQMLMMNTNVKDFIISGKDEDVGHFKEYYQKFTEFLNQAKEQIRNPERATLIARQEGQAAAYNQAFDQVVELARTRNQLVNGVLRETGPKMEKQLTAIMESAKNSGDADTAFQAGTALRHMLLGRLYVQKFLDTNAAEDENRVTSELDDFLKQIDSLTQDLLNSDWRQRLTEVAELSRQYRDSFTEIAKTIYARNELITNTLDVIGPQIADDIENVKLSYIRDQDELGPALQARAAKAETIVAVVAIVALILGIGASLIITRTITKPIAKVVSFVDVLAKGDFTAKLNVTQQDEIGKMSKALAQTVSELGGMIRQIISGVSTLSSSSTELSAVSSQLSTNAENATSRSSGVASAAEELSTNMSSVSAAMEQSASNIGMVATATEEMSSTVEEISRNASKAKEISEKAVGQSRQTSQKMNDLGIAADKIGKVTEAITEISEQTNLLALNATIEAARAGEAGKGFAVVANEIKELAKQTAEATVDIKHQIEEMQQTTSGTVSDIKNISDVISDINEIITTIAAAVEEQSAATGEIAENIAQASAGIAEVNENVAQSSVAVENITRDIVGINDISTDVNQGSHHVRESAGELSRLAEQLNSLVKRFTVA